jgi:Tol biopolymer transport system component
MIRSFLSPPFEVELCSDCGVAVSPDGRRLAFVARQGATTPRRLWVQSLGDVSARPMDGTEGARFPFWSPDSQSLAFFAGNTLNRIGLAGGSPQRLCSPCTGQGTWGESGIIVFGAARNHLRGVSASGGQPFQVTELDPSQTEGGHLHPVFLPGGRRLLFRQRASTTGPGGIYTASLDSKATELVIAVSGIHTPYSKVFVAAGHLLFVRPALASSFTWNLALHSSRGWTAAARKSRGCRSWGRSLPQACRTTTVASPSREWWRELPLRVTSGCTPCERAGNTFDNRSSSRSPRRVVPQR